MQIKVSEFIAAYCGGGEYRHGIYVPQDVRVKIMNCQLEDVDVCDVPDDVFDRIEEAKRKDILREKHYTDVSVCRLAGMKAEEDDDIDEAIRQYAEAIELGEASEFDLTHAYRHAYDRIIILLSRTHNYAREVEYIERLLKYQLQDSERERLTTRLEKKMKLIKK